MPGPFIHQIDPVLAKVGGVYLWWYGLGYALGFLEIHLWLRRARQRLGLELSEVYNLSISFALGVLLGGRMVEVIFYEWPFYRDHLWLVPACWLGGMATHGILLGAIVGTWLFCRLHGKRFLVIVDELVVPGAFLMGVGRIGNFIDGQIVGRVTDAWWGVQFPDAEGFRHPVVLYDGLKNLALIPFLLWIRKQRPPLGIVTAHFIFWYGFLRIFVDIFREHPTTLLGVATGQAFNLFMTAVGAFLFVWFRRRGQTSQTGTVTLSTVTTNPLTLSVKRVVFILLLAFSLTMPSDWTQDVPQRYGNRHPGMQHSRLYPPIP
jgi:phosphatidylglycerol:prolipoprotein diacylglycerol transferase